MECKGYLHTFLNYSSQYPPMSSSLHHLVVEVQSVRKENNEYPSDERNFNRGHLLMWSGQNIIVQVCALLCIVVLQIQTNQMRNVFPQLSVCTWLQDAGYPKPNFQNKNGLQREKMIRRHPIEEACNQTKCHSHQVSVYSLSSQFRRN